LLAEHRLEPSISRRGNGYDNAHMASFFSSFKLELAERSSPPPMH